MIAGVAGGLAEFWDADPSLIRIVWALLVVLTGGIALLVYIIMAIVVPEGRADDGSTSAPHRGRRRGPARGQAPLRLRRRPGLRRRRPHAATAAFWQRPQPVGIGCLGVGAGSGRRRRQPASRRACRPTGRPCRTTAPGRRRVRRHPDPRRRGVPRA